MGGWGGVGFQFEAGRGHKGFRGLRLNGEKATWEFPKIWGGGGGGTLFWGSF